jgi:hypothetical protein
MNRSFRFLCATGMAALLVACGGGSDTDTSSQPAWGSPAMFVPAGTSQVNVALASCEVGSADVAQALEAPQATLTRPITSPSLVITADGDVIFSGVRNGSSTVSELVRVNFAQASYRRIELSFNADQHGFALQQGNASINTDYASTNRYLRAEDADGTRYFCGSRAQLTAAYAPSEARLAEKLSRGATTWISSAARGTPTAIVDNLVVWNNQMLNATLPSNQTSARYASLNVSTGALNIGPGSSAANITQSVVLTAALASGGYYFELDSTDSDTTSGRSKEVELSFDSGAQGVLTFNATRADNVLVVHPSLGNFIIGPLPVLP